LQVVQDVELVKHKVKNEMGHMTQQFGAFTATEIYCAKCQRSQPVRERLLLVLPSGELHEYLCSRCGSSVGTRTVTAGELMQVSPTPRAGADPGLRQTILAALR
jgi:hypothetical protein